MIESELRSFFEGRLVDARPLADDDDLIDSGVLDSLALVELIDHLETSFAVVVAGADLDADNFESITSIAALVRRLRAGASPAPS
jgi:methoxymalonate biosynthesis acyl carrier protein